MFVHKDIYIRAIEPEDLAFLAESRNDPNTWRYLGVIDFLNSFKQDAWLESSSKNKKVSNFILCLDNGTRIGFVRMDEIDHINKSIRVGGDIHAKFRGQGFGRKMYELIFKFCFDQLNMNRVWLLVLDFNETALNLYKKMGMKIEGSQREAVFREGKYHDYIMMSILASEYRSKDA